MPADSTEAFISLSMKGAKLTGQEERLTFSKIEVKTARKPLLWTGLCALGSDWTQGNPPLTSASLWHYWRGDTIFQVLHSMWCWKGQPPFTLYEHVSQCKVIPCSTRKAYQLYWDLFSACSCPCQARWHVRTYRYKKGGWKKFILNSFQLYTKENTRKL